MMHEISHESATAQRRISEALARCVARQGSAVSLNDVAREAGVSKALILYHFTDKDALVAHAIGDLGAAIVAREGRALEHRGALPLDALWAWLEGELRRGDVCILLELGGFGGERTRIAAGTVATARRAATAAIVARLFELLQLSPRVPPPMLADVVVAFTDGLALESAREGARDPRVAFDVFWLALLSLAE